MKLISRHASRSMAWALVCSIVAAPTARANDPPTSFEGHIDLVPFVIALLPADTEDVAPYVPEGFELLEVGGETSIFVDVGYFENSSFDLDDGSSLEDPAPYGYAEVVVPTYGPDESGDGGLVELWRLAGIPVFPDALARLGVVCDVGDLRHTRACHLPGLTVDTVTSATETTVRASVPYEYSPFTMSASFVPMSIPWEALGMLPIPAWHRGSRGLVRETIVWGSYPDTALIGIGTSTVAPESGSPLAHMLGIPQGGQAMGTALLVSAPAVHGTFVLG